MAIIKVFSIEDLDICYDLIKDEILPYPASGLYQIAFWKFLDIYAFLDFVKDVETNTSDIDLRRKIIDKANLISRIIHDYRFVSYDTKAKNRIETEEFLKRIKPC